VNNNVFIWVRSSRIIYRGGAISMLALALLSLPFTVHVWKSWWGAYSGYSGIVVDKGNEFHPLASRHWSMFLILKDAQGKTFKKYVGDYGYAFSHVGTFVVKKKGFGEYHCNREMFQELERIKAEKAKNNSSRK
jgi:hypothetical protein